MAVQITMVPVWADGDETIPTTKLCIQIDLSTVQKQLERYDLLVEAEVVVNTFDPVTNQMNLSSYPYATIVDNSEQKELKYLLTVSGSVTSEEQILVSSKGYWMRKKEKGGA